MDEYKFKAGDVVVTSKDQIGTVKKVTPTGRITVDFGRYESKYRPDGYLIGADAWNSETIEILTEERHREIEQRKVVKKCFSVMSKTDRLTYKQAVQILEILEPKE